MTLFQAHTTRVVIISFAIAVLLCNRLHHFRYFVLYEYGGFYADIDSECLKSLAGVVAQHTCILGQEPEEHAQFLSSYGIPLVRFFTCVLS